MKSIHMHSTFIHEHTAIHHGITIITSPWFPSSSHFIQKKKIFPFALHDNFFSEHCKMMSHAYECCSREKFQCYTTCKYVTNGSAHRKQFPLCSALLSLLKHHVAIVAATTSSTGTLYKITYICTFYSTLVYHSTYNSKQL